jgi:hypothetical protein
MIRLRFSRTRWAYWAGAGLLVAIVVGAAFASAANISVPVSRAGVMTIPVPHGQRGAAPSAAAPAKLVPDPTVAPTPEPSPGS